MWDLYHAIAISHLGYKEFNLQIFAFVFRQSRCKVVQRLETQFFQDIGYVDFRDIHIGLTNQKIQIGRAERWDFGSVVIDVFVNEQTPASNKNQPSQCARILKLGQNFYKVIFGRVFQDSSLFRQCPLLRF